MTWYKNKVLNKIVGSGLKLFSVTLPEYIQRKFQNRWRLSGIRVIRLSNGVTFKFMADWDDSIADHLYNNPEQYPEIHELLLFTELAKKSNVILDIGANTGLYSVCSSMSNSKASIYAFEPYVVNALRLKKNIALNTLKNITVVEKALGNENGKVLFTVPLNDRICDALSVDKEFTKQFYTNEIEYTELEVNQITLDCFIESNKIDKVDLIKIDVENYEWPVLYGAKELLVKNSPVILIEIFVNDEKIKSFEEFLKPMGYSCYIVLSDGLVKTDTLINNPDCRNYIFSKKESKVKYLSFKNMPLIMAELF